MSAFDLTARQQQRVSQAFLGVFGPDKPGFEESYNAAREAAIARVKNGGLRQAQPTPAVGDLVLVDWEDAYVEHGDAKAEDMKPAIEHTVGFVVRMDTDGAMVLAWTRHGAHIVEQTGETYCDLQRIPGGMVRGVQVLRGGEPPTVE